MDFLKDVFGSGMNIFGASAPQNTQRMIDAGLLKADAGEKAQSQSLMRGLLGAGVSYLAQPQNQNYGSVTPYIGKALQAGMEAAQKPYDNMYEKAKQNHAMNQIAEEKLAKENKSKFESGLFQPNSTIKGLERKADPRLDRTDVNGVTSQVGPNFNPIQQTSTPTFDSAKYLKDSLDKGLIDSEEYFKYKKLLNPTVDPVNVADGGALVNPQTGELIYENPKNEFEKTSNDFRVWNEMGGPNSKYKTFNEYIDRPKNPGVNVEVNTGDKGGDSQKVRDEYDKVFISSQNDAAALNSQLNDLQQMERLISQAGATGAGSEAILGLQKIADRLGFDVDTSQMSATEAMRALSNKLALGMRKAGSGVMTDKDFQVFLESVPSIKNSAEANRRILEWTRDSHQRRMKLAEVIDDYKTSTKSIYGSEKQAGTLDGGIYKVIRNYWKGVREERQQQFFKEDGLDPSGNEGPGAFEVDRS
jgi:hypothetical protein